MKRILTLLISACSALTLHADETSAQKPNILFIAVDDLNDWIGCMGGNEQSITPNFDRLAKKGMLFTNAHCVAPACNPSRTAVMSGLSTHKTGVYDNGQNMRDVLPNEKILPEYFRDHGYTSLGSGKILHYFTDARSWDDYFPEKSTERPIPQTYYPGKRPVSLKRGGPWQYVETDWGPMPVEGREFGGDFLVSDYVGKQLSKKHDKPFFLACGIYRPHEPWFVPQKYFDKFPLEDIKLPPAYKKGDLDDLPKAGQAIGHNRYFPHIKSQNQWKQGVQGYLASINYADTMLGRVLDALEKGPNKDNTIVVLWSDHGWHLGSKEHWQKYTAWRACTRIPFMVSVPKGISKALPAGVKPGSVSNNPVSLISVFPTLTELCGIPAKEHVDGKSLLPILKDPTASVDPVVITYLHTVGSIGISGKEWRYIRYADKSEELYHIKNDPYEWNNLATDAKYEETLKEFRKHIPAKFTPKPKVKVRDLPALTWVPRNKESSIPKSVNDNTSTRLAVVNRTNGTIKISRVSKAGKHIFKSKLGSKKQIELDSSPGASWVVSDENDAILGHFVHGDRPAKVIIP